MAKKYSLYSPAAMLQRKVLRESRRGNRTWQGVAGALWVGSIVRRALVRREEPAAIERLKPGEAVTITTIPRPSRRQRRKEAKG
jgi:hypothetical protein